MDHRADDSKITFWVASILGTGAFFALQGRLYWLEEVLACWLLFSVAFGFITIAALMGVAIYSVILGVFRLVAGAARVIPHVRLTTPTLHLK